MALDRKREKERQKQEVGGVENVIRSDSGKNANLKRGKNESRRAREEAKGKKEERKEEMRMMREPTLARDVASRDGKHGIKTASCREIIINDVCRDVRRWRRSVREENSICIFRVRSVRLGIYVVNVENFPEFSIEKSARTTRTAI